MSFSDLFLYPPEENQNDVRLGDPTEARSTTITIGCAVTASTESYAAEVLAEKFVATVTASTETRAGVVLAESFSTTATAATETGSAVVLAEKFATVIQSATETSAGEVVAESESFAVTAGTETGADAVAGVVNPQYPDTKAGGGTGGKRRRQVWQDEPYDQTPVPVSSYAYEAWSLEKEAREQEEDDELMSVFATMLSEDLV